VVVLLVVVVVSVVVVVVAVVEVVVSVVVVVLVVVVVVTTVSHWEPVKPGLQTHVPDELVFVQVPLPLHSVSQKGPLKHGKQLQTEALVHEPTLLQRVHPSAGLRQGEEQTHIELLKPQNPPDGKLQFSGQPPVPDTRVTGHKVTSEVAIASEARTVRTVRPADVCI
jgi:hypothetical protein